MPNIEELGQRKRDRKFDGKIMMAHSWSFDEKVLFVEAVKLYGKDYDEIVGYIGGTKSRQSVINYTSQFA